MSSLTVLAGEAERCRACVLCDTRHRVVFSSGPSSASVVVIGEAPGAEEDARGVPFVGRSGTLLSTLLAEVGLARAELYVTNVVKCRPPANRPPRAGEIAACRHFLEGQLSAVAPSVVITLGATATRAVLGTGDSLGSVRGAVHRGVVAGAAVVPTFHPAAGLRGGAAIIDLLRSDLALAAGLADEMP